MGDIAHLIRVFYTDSDDKEQWRRNLADRVAAQIALLQAEHRDYKQRAEAAEARAADLAESNREQDEVINTLRAELDLANAHAARLMQERDEARRLEDALRGMISGWRDYANGHYCRIYNPGMTQGLNCAADALEAYVTGLDTLTSTAPAARADQEPE